MSRSSEHPMDAFPVRPLQFDFDSLQPSDVVWSKTCPEFAVFFNALALHVPYFERYLIRTMSAARPQVHDERLKRDMVSISGQEAFHAQNFVRINQLLAKRYPRIAKLDAQARDYFATRARNDSLKRLVGFTAGYETFTFLGGMVILQGYEKWFADSNPVMKAMWVWHQVEEIEHGSVAFDVYQALFPNNQFYRNWMVLSALSHIAIETLRAYIPMCRREGWLRNPFRAVARIGFAVRMLGLMLWCALPVFRKGYHPRKHPLATTQQNPIQIAWRRYEGRGGDVLAIDHEKMAKIMDIGSA